MGNTQELGKSVHSRIRDDFNVTIETKEIPEFSVTVLNISASGIYCVSSKRLGDLTRVEIVLRMSDDLCIKARAVVIREEELLDNSYGIGLFFTRISAENREYISNFVNCIS